MLGLGGSPRRWAPPVGVYKLGGKVTVLYTLARFECESTAVHYTIENELKLVGDYEWSLNLFPDCHFEELSGCSEQNKAARTRSSAAPAGREGREEKRRSKGCHISVAQMGTLQKRRGDDTQFGGARSGGAGACSGLNQVLKS